MVDKVLFSFFSLIFRDRLVILLVLGLLLIVFVSLRLLILLFVIEICLFRFSFVNKVGVVRLIVLKVKFVDSWLFVGRFCLVSSSRLVMDLFWRINCLEIFGIRFSRFVLVVLLRDNFFSVRLRLVIDIVVLEVDILVCNVKVLGLVFSD